MKIVFAGTPEIAKIVLGELLTQYNIGLVLTQPDRPSGRGKKINSSPVKQLALVHNIEVLQPADFKNNPEAIEKLRQFEPDIMVVIAYGIILPKEILSIPKLGCVNIHVSLLPSWRGAAPIQRSIMAGDTVTGVTIMQMDSGMDTGDILIQEQILIEETDTSGILHDKLAQLGSKLILHYLANHNDIKPYTQPLSNVTYAKKIDKQEALINWDKDAKSICRQIRAFNPSPGAFTQLNHKIIKLWQAKVSNSKTNQKVGTIINVYSDIISVACGNSTVLDILELQLEGKNRQLVKQFASGYPNLVNLVFES